VYTVGAGTNGTARIKINTGFGFQYRQIAVEIDEGMLREIAERTGGTYFRATDVGELENIYARIDSLERSTFEEQRFLEYNQLYASWLALGLALVIGAFVLRGTALRRVP